MGCSGRRHLNKESDPDTQRRGVGNAARRGEKRRTKAGGLTCGPSLIISFGSISASVKEQPPCSKRLAIIPSSLTCSVL